MTVDGDDGADGRRTGDGRAADDGWRGRGSAAVGGSAGSMWRRARKSFSRGSKPRIAMTVDGDGRRDGRRTGDGRADGVVVRERRIGVGGSGGLRALTVRTAGVEDAEKICRFRRRTSPET